MGYSTRRIAIQRAREYLAVRPVFLDTETTGLDSSAEIIEISVVDSEGIVQIDSLVRPTRPIPLEVIKLHQIDNEMVKGAPTWPEVWPSVEAALRGRYVGIYNAEFDLRMLRQSHYRTGMNWDFPSGRIFDVMKLYSNFSAQERWQSLASAGRQCGLALPNTHRARDDTMLLRALLIYIAGRPI